MASPDLDVHILKKFQPLNTLGVDKIQEVIDNSVVQNLPVGRMLFKQGDKDKWTVYLLSGTVQLKNSDGKIQYIEAKSNKAKMAIANELPRPASAKAKTNISILIIDRDLLDGLLNWNSPFVTDESESDSNEDWMTRFLQSNIFLQLPSSNIHALMKYLHEIPLAKGSVIIKENNNNKNNDNFYIIQQGLCVVSKKNPKNGKQIILAELRPGDSFGEDAIITGNAHGASVTMKTNGVLLCLGKKDFIDLLVEPLVHRVALKKIDVPDTNKLQLIDVRNEYEFSDNGLDNSLNIPINLLRSQFSNLSKSIHYIVYSGHEHRSVAASYLFILNGYQCSILEGGIGDAVAPPKLTSIITDDKELNASPKKTNKVTGGRRISTLASEKADATEAKKRTLDHDRRIGDISSSEIKAALKKAEGESKPLTITESAELADKEANRVREEVEKDLKQSEQPDDTLSIESSLEKFKNCPGCQGIAIINSINDEVIGSSINDFVHQDIQSLNFFIKNTLKQSKDILGDYNSDDLELMFRMEVTIKAEQKKIIWLSVSSEHKYNILLLLDKSFLEKLFLIKLKNYFKNLVINEQSQN